MPAPPSPCSAAAGGLASTAAQGSWRQSYPDDHHARSSRSVPAVSRGSGQIQMSPSSEPDKDIMKMKDFVIHTYTYSADYNKSFKEHYESKFSPTNLLIFLRKYHLAYMLLCL